MLIVRPKTWWYLWLGSIEERDVAPVSSDIRRLLVGSHSYVTDRIGGGISHWLWIHFDTIEGCFGGNTNVSVYEQIEKNGKSKSKPFSINDVEGNYD